MSENLNDNNDELATRIQNADPAAKAVAPHDSLIHRAIATAEENGHKKTFKFLRPKNRLVILRSLSTIGAMALVLGFAAPSIIGSLSPARSGFLFDATGANKGAAAMSSSKIGAGAAVSDMAGPCVAADGTSPCAWTPTEYQYVAGAGLSNDSGSAQIYKLVPNRSASETMTLVAAAIGISGATKTLDSPDSTWTTLYKGLNPDGSEGWGKPQLTVTYDSQIKLPQWGYTGNQTLYTDCAHQADAANGLDVPLIDPNQQNGQENVCISAISGRSPTAAEAMVSAKKLFKALGYDSGTSLSKLQDGDLYLEAPATANLERAGISINGYLVVGGNITSMAMSIGWDGSSKDISYASGFDGKAEAQGAFGTVSPVAAVDRLSKWEWFGNPYLDYANLKYSDAMNQGGPIAYSSTLGSADVTSSAATTGSAVAPSGGSTAGASTNPSAPAVVASPDPMPSMTPKVVNITIERAKAALMVVYAADGSIWFVPGFVFYDSTGYVGNVLCVVEGVIKLPEPMPIDGVMVK